METSLSEQQSFLYEQQGLTNISLFKRAFATILYVSTAIEMFAFPDISNMVGALVSILSMLIFFRCVFRIEVIRERPVSFVALLNLSLFMYLPLPVTLLDGNAMSHDLYSPIKTYILQFAYYLVAILSFLAAKKAMGLRLLNQRILLKAGYFQTPTVRQLWILCCIGWVFKAALLGQQYGEEATAGAGSLNMFAQFIYSPILILFLPLMGGSRCSDVMRTSVYVYIVFMMIFLISTNSRSQMLSAVVLWGCGYFLTKIYEHSDKIWLSFRMIILGIIAVFVISGPVTDMGTAMLVTRAERSDLSFSDLLKRTIEVYQDKESLNAYKAMMEKRSKDEDSHAHSIEWREKYVSNLFLDRLCNYRVADATIFHAERAGFGNATMREHFIDQLKIMFPAPIVKLLFGDIDKGKYRYSSMDKLYSVSRGRAVTGGYRVGGDVGLGLATFGFLYYPLVFIVYMLCFVLMDSVLLYYDDEPVFSIFTFLGLYFTYFLMFGVAGGIISQVIFLIWGFFFRTFWHLVVYKLSSTLK